MTSSSVRRAVPWWSVAFTAASLGGVATTLAFAPARLALFAVLGPALGLWAFRRAGTAARGALTGMAYGVAFTFVVYRWMLTLDLIAYIVLAVLQAAFWALTGFVAARTAHLRPGRWVVSVAATWTLVEAVRARVPITGFEWGQLGLSTGDTVLRRAAAIVGSLGLTGLLVAVAAGVVVLIADRRLRGGVPLALSALAVVIATALGSVWWTTPGTTLRIALVQAEAPCPGAFAEDCPGYSDVLLESYVAGTEGLPTTPDLIVWGEDGLRGGETLDAVGRRFVDRFGPIRAPLLAGTATPGAPGQFYRLAALFDRDGTPLDVYAKRQPVPFGEYVPLRSVLGGISDVSRLVPSDAIPGADSSPLEVPAANGTARIGTVISWEVVFSRLVRDVGRHAGGLATLTTVSSYGTTEASDQLLGAAQLRAAEQQKPMAVAATTGRSAIILATGELAGRTELFRADALVGDMPLRNGLTPYARGGDLPVVVLMAATLVLVGLRQRRTRPMAGDQESTSAPTTAGGEPVDSATRR